MDADTAAYVRARRPKVSILCARPILRTVITDKLHEQWSPQQISVWLRREYPDDPQMWVSHETIYRYLYIPSRKVFDSTVFHRVRPTLRTLWEDNYHLYGVRKLWKAARRAGLVVGRDQVARLMRTQTWSDGISPPLGRTNCGLPT